MKKSSIIGFGYWGPKVLASLNTLKIQVKYICDINKAKFDNTHYKGTKFINDIDIICKDIEIDTVFICTDPNSHFKLCKKLLKSNKNLFVEKPICKTFREFNFLKKLALERKLTLYEDLIYTKSDHILYLQKHLSKKNLKPFLFQTTRSNLGKVDFGSDVIEDLSHHDLSIILFLFKKLPTRCFAKLFQPNKNIPKSIAEIYLEFGNSLFCTINLSWYSPIKIRKIFVHTNSEMIEFDDIESDRKIKIYKRKIVKKSKHINYRSGQIIIPDINIKNSPLENSIITFFKLIKMESKNSAHLEVSENVLRIKSNIRKSLLENRFVKFS